MILTKPKTKTHTKFFLNQQKSLELHAQRAGEESFVHKCPKGIVLGIETSFCTKKLSFNVSSDNSSEGIR